MHACIPSAAICTPAFHRPQYARLLHTTRHSIIGVACLRLFTNVGAMHQHSCSFCALQPFRGVIALDSLTLYDHGGITAFDAARCRCHRPCHVACCQHHRQPNRQGGEQCQEDLFYVLFHCAEFLVFLFCTDLTDFTDIFAQLHPCNPCYPYRLSWFVLYGSYGYFYPSASVCFRVFRVVCFIRTRIFTECHGYFCSSASVLFRVSPCSFKSVRILLIFRISCPFASV